MSSSTYADDSASLTGNAIGAHLERIRNAIPPSVRNLCFPESTSTLIRNLVILSAVENFFLFFCTLTTAGVRFMGYPALVSSLTSCVHIVLVGSVLSSHVLQGGGLMSIGGGGGQFGSYDTPGGGGGGGYGPPAGVGGTVLSRVVTSLSQLSIYATQPFMLGALFGSTLVMALLMHILSNFFGDLSSCVGAAAALASKVDSETASIEECGSHGAAAGVWFFAGFLFWLDISLAGVLFVKRDELLADAQSNAYQDIDSPRDAGTFQGDFPNGATAMTMHV